MDTFEEIMSDADNTPSSVADADPALEVSETVSTGADDAGDFADILNAPEETPAISTEEEPPTSEEPAVGEGEKTPETDKPGEAVEAVTDEEIDKALQNPKTGKWFKNAVTHTRERLTQAELELEGYRVYGAKEELEKLRDVHENLYGFEEKDGEIISKVSRFAQNFVKEDAARAVELTNELLAQDSPLNPNRSLFDEILELPEVQDVLKERFGASSEDDPNLAIVPTDKRAAYNALTPEVKEEFRFMAEAARNALLAQAQKELDRTAAQEKAKIAANEESLKKFNSLVEETAVKNFNTVTDEFYSSLKEIPFSSAPKLNKFLQSTVYDKVLTVVTMGETYAGKRAIADLTEFGLTIPPEVPALVKKLEADSRLLTIASWKNNQRALDYYASEVATTQKQLAGRSNEIAAAIAKAVGEIAKADAATGNETLDKQKTKTRPAVAGAGGGGGGGETRDLSNLSFEEILAAG